MEHSFPLPGSLPRAAFTTNPNPSSVNAEYGTQLLPSHESITRQSSTSLLDPSCFSSGKVMLHGAQSVSSVSASAVNARPRQLVSTSAQALDSSSSLAPLNTVPGSESIMKKQQRELELLVKELKDRDRELNDMVRMHQHHLGSWAEDKRKVAALEQRCVELQDLMSTKDSQLLAVKASLSEVKSKEHNKSSELKGLKRQHELDGARLHKLELQLGNAEAKLARTQQQESSLRSLLEGKERELQALSRKLEEVQHLLDTKIHEIKSDEAVLREQVTGLTEQNDKHQKSAESLQGQLFESHQRNEQLELDLARARDEANMLRKHLEVAYDSEKRKEQLLALQKSKLERYEVELTSTRKVCAQQQKELTAVTTLHGGSQRKQLFFVNGGRREHHHRSELLSKSGHTT